MKKNIFAIALVVTTLFTASCSKPYNELETESKTASEAYFITTNENRTNANNVVFSQVIQLEGSQEVPGVITATKGIAFLSVTADSVLHSKVIIKKLAIGDVLRFAHIHVGAAGINGPVSINLVPTAADFGVNKELRLNAVQYTLITTGASYVNAHSNFFPGGIVRGQIR